MQQVPGDDAGGSVVLVERVAELLHDVIIESACLWLEDVNSIQINSAQYLPRGAQLLPQRVRLQHQRVPFLHPRAPNHFIYSTKSLAL